MPTCGAHTPAVESSHEPPSSSVAHDPLASSSLHDAKPSHEPELLLRLLLVQLLLLLLVSGLVVVFATRSVGCHTQCGECAVQLLAVSAALQFAGWFITVQFDAGKHVSMLVCQEQTLEEMQSSCTSWHTIFSSRDAPFSDSCNTRVLFSTQRIPWPD